ncbi:MAG: thermonuclease family protein [Pseudomonadota bacterium]
MRFTGKALLVSAFLLYGAPLPLALLHAAPKTPAVASTEVVQVRHALDGDSLLLSDGRQVRLIGVNTPEIDPSSHRGGHDKRHAVTPQPLAREAQRFTAAHVDGKTVTLHFETERTDRYQRLLAHVTLPDGTRLEEALLREGLGWMVAIPPNVAELARLQTAEDGGRGGRRGVWGRPEYQPVAAERLTTKDAGFLIVSGTVRAVHQSSYAYYFELAPHANLLVPRAEWNRYFASLYARPQTLVGRRIVARGWASAHDGRLRLRVAHPAMLTLVN